MIEKKLLLKENTVLGLHENIRLRREETSISLYWAVPPAEANIYGGSASIYMPSATAVTLAFFDGKRTLKEIFQAVKYIWGNSPLTFDDFCKGLEKFVFVKTPPFNFNVPVLIEVIRDKKQKFMRYTPESFIIKGDNFNTTVHVSKFPTTISVMPSMECFTDCVYCYMWPHPKYSPISFSRWKELLEEMGEYELSQLGFNGGDPMHYAYTIDMLEIASTFEPHPYISVATKAYISPEIAQRIARIINLEFQISLDSTDQKIADAMTQRKGYGNRAIESLKNLVKAGITPAVKAVLTPQTIKSMSQTILDLHSLGVHPIRVTNYFRSPSRHKDELFNKADECEEFLKIVKEIEAKHGIEVQLQGSPPEVIGKPLQLTFEQRKKRWDNRSGCSLGKTILYILPDGNLLGCEQIPQKPEYFLGSVANKSIYEVWNSEEFKEKTYEIPREKYKGTACYNCPEFKECHSASGKGYCMRESYKLWGTIYAPEPNCPYNDKELPRQQ